MVGNEKPARFPSLPKLTSAQSESERDDFALDRGRQSKRRDEEFVNSI